MGQHTTESTLLNGSVDTIYFYWCMYYVQLSLVLYINLLIHIAVYQYRGVLHKIFES